MEPDWATEDGADAAEDDALERKIYEAFYGPFPKCDCCGKRNTRTRWRPAYQMMLCPNCPPKSLPRPNA
jgi:hypothetical protein